MLQRLFFACFFFLFSFSLGAQQLGALREGKRNTHAPYLAEGITFVVGTPADSLRVTFSKGDEQSQVMSPGPNTIWLAQKNQNSSYSDLVITFSKPVSIASFSISHLNNNTDGMEILENFDLFNEDNQSVKASTKMQWGGNPAVTTFNRSTLMLQAVKGHCCEEASGRLTLSSTRPFTTVTFRQRVIAGVPNGVIVSDAQDLSVKAPQPIKQIPSTITTTSLSQALAASQEKETQRRDSVLKQTQVLVKKDAIKPAEKKPEPKEVAKVTAKKTSGTATKKTNTATAKKTTATKKKTAAHDISELQSLQAGDKIKLNRVFFKQSVAELLPDSYQQLDTLVMLLKQYKTLEIELQGHTDNQGNAEKNRILSEQRVTIVKQYLVDKGIAAERLKTKGLGMTEPKAPNDTEENRKLNRRVEFVITKR